MNLSHLVAHYKELKERLAVWEVVRIYLTLEFLPRDERAAKHSIVVDALLGLAGKDTTVRPETITKLVAEIEEGPIASLRRELENIEQQELSISANA